MTLKVLVANRGAIAVRIFRTLKALNIRSVAVYAEADAQSRHVSMADEAFCLGSGSVKETYLNQNKLLGIARAGAINAVHPGYGFLSENAEFCESLEKMGIVFLGPTADQMRVFGLKHQARALAEKNAVPLLPGTGLLEDVESALSAAETIAYPVMLKSTAGGGGIGMQVCSDAKDLKEAWDSIVRLSENNFSNSGIFLEKYIQHARHVEVQVFGSGTGGVLVLGDRDCSAQRRHQKVIEEAPAPNIPEPVRASLHSTARILSESVQYRSAGTVEFIYDQQNHSFYFLEVNTRLQVEHGVTECIFNVDLVAWMVQLGLNQLPPWQTLSDGLKQTGHAVQARIYAENPAKAFQPSAGLLTHVAWPELSQDSQCKLRIDHWVEAGQTVSPLYDPMLAKVIVSGPNRESTVAELEKALTNVSIQGIATNTDYVSHILKSDTFGKALTTTRFLSTLEYRPAVFEVLSSGTQTTIQDYPGRLGFWHVGVPPSGPFDALSFRLGNRLLGNAENAAGLEMVQQGVTLKFYEKTELTVTGADVDVFIDEQAVSSCKVIGIDAKQILRIGRVKKTGARIYLLIRGGIQCIPYLGSRSTFTLGQFGGTTGAALKTGDIVGFVRDHSSHKQSTAPLPAQYLNRCLSNHWQIRVMYGPHGAPDFFTPLDMERFFSADWEVHYNSSRTGIRLLGPKPEWARTDGGEAGMHPSNIHDNAYAIGAIDFTGDMPVILGPDGPSLGGFVCPATVITADLWKLGQLRAGDKISFCLVDLDGAKDAFIEQESSIAELEVSSILKQNFTSLSVDKLTPVIGKMDAAKNQVEVLYRQSGDANILVEYGPQQLDLALRFRVHALMSRLEATVSQDQSLQSQIIDITPGIRSLQVHYDPLRADQKNILALLQKTESELVNLQSMRVPSRIVHLPLSWDDEQCHKAVEKYMQSVRKDAPWCPDNIEFIRRINGLKNVAEVKRIVFDASYVVMGLGDVYLGAPVATPVDPRHRLVTTKYNPARTWTAENSVGIGGSYLCVYGMEGPGGYQFVGRTCQMWNRYRQTKAFTQPWLLRFFDQIRFFEVDSEALEDIRHKVPLGEYDVRIEETEFSLNDYLAFLEHEKESIEKFTMHRKMAFSEELQRWHDTGQFHFESDMPDLIDDQEIDLPEGCELIESPVSGNVWKVLVSEGETYKAGQVLCVLESMKMEIEVAAPQAGRVEQIVRKQGQSISGGESLFVIRLVGEE